MPQLLTHIRDILRNRNLVAYGDTLIVGVSGGPDSMALLNLLARMRTTLGLKLIAAHVNHGLRRTAGRDERCVRQACVGLQIPCHVKKLSLGRRRSRGSVEEIARNKRLQFFSASAKKLRADAVALAHTKDDLAETVLMRILRGTGLQGLQGMPLSKNINGMKIIRPLLGISKHELLNYLQKEKIAFQVDESNSEQKFFRNKIRLELLPLLERKYNADIREVLTNLSKTAAVDYEYLSQAARQEFKRSFKILGPNSLSAPLARMGKLHPALRRGVIRLAVQKIRGDSTALALRHMEEIEDLIQNRPNGSAVSLPDGLCARKKEGRLHLVPRSRPRR
ncbi:MAG: tRNA lysidine(34) synthetase TilS [Candidatus Omnitrophota bacterium]|nr:tRNA lysidine(34) synthetase TilS [Candidatus Omnitrophota bacterium]MDZ4242200.1 tRNA lysidine(34) synthetase TilS [Candidatus Omnitrophota bacterium]